MKKSNETKADRKLAINVTTKVEALYNARVAWEQGTYKKSNEELYELLNSCLVFYLATRSKPKECKALNRWLNERKIAYNASASLQTRIVRAVFGDCGKRAYTYARVITVASEEKSPKESMFDFISKRGGIEEIRRTKSGEKSPSVSRQDNIKFAIDELEVSNALIAPFSVKASKRKQPEGEAHNLFVAIMRQETDGSYSMVFETSAAGVVNAALAQAGKENSAAAHNEATVKNLRNAVNESENALAKAIDAGALDEAA